MKKPATTDFPIHEILTERWSPRAFRSDLVDREQLGSLFEAARWGASCFNAQPWHFLVATRDDEAGYAKLASCLADANAVWATKAPVLVVAIAAQNFAHNGKPNRHALHDVGLALGNLTVQAQALGLSVHQMAGFDADKARQVCAIPDGFEPVAMAAIGYRGDPQGLPEPLRARESAPRERRPLAEFVFGATWNSASPIG
ncbi:MAG: nitroreductase family protein [Planctomycetes bacterium]|nr:nitroreductase family protein [Planctomycetota bacterium]